MAWGTTKHSNSNRLQTLQYKIHKKMIDAPFYISNLTNHSGHSFVRDLSTSRD